MIRSFSRVPDYDAGGLEAVRGTGAQSRRCFSVQNQTTSKRRIYTLSTQMQDCILVKEASVEVREPKDQHKMINALFVSKEGPLS